MKSYMYSFLFLGMSVIILGLNFQSILNNFPPTNLDTPQAFSSTNYIPHSPIEISNNTELAAAAVSGTGTANDPYILENWNITQSPSRMNSCFQNDGNVTPSTAHGIYIHDTTSYFAIRNCWIDTGEELMFGIYIKNITAGTGSIYDNYCTNSFTGIYISSSNNILVNNNTCVNNGDGIRLSHSNHSQVLNNECLNNGQGIVLASFNTTISNNNCSQNSQSGIYLSSVSSNSTILNNICYLNNDSGMFLYAVDNCTINGNVLRKNQGKGITLYLFGCENNIIIYNVFVENQYWGLILHQGCTNNSIYLNAFINNNLEYGDRQGSDNGHNNTWYDPLTKQGNYWSDYSGVGAYSIDDSLAQDLYPLNDSFISEMNWESYYPDSVYTPLPIIFIFFAILILCIPKISLRVKKE